MTAPRDTLTELTDAYIECALWSSTGDDITDEHGLRDLSPECIEMMRDDCRSFYLDNEDLIEPDNYIGDSTYGVAQMVGHDLWLTRSGHGAGFWDGDWKEPAATTLTLYADTLGNIDLYVGDDGLIYGS